MDRPAPDFSFVETFRRRSAEFSAKAEEATSPEVKLVYRDLAKMYEDMAGSTQGLSELWAALQPQAPDAE